MLPAPAARLATGTRSPRPPLGAIRPGDTAPWEAASSGHLLALPPAGGGPRNPCPQHGGLQFGTTLERCFRFPLCLLPAGHELRAGASGCSCARATHGARSRAGCAGWGWEGSCFPPIPRHEDCPAAAQLVAKTLTAGAEPEDSTRCPPGLGCQWEAAQRPLFSILLPRLVPVRSRTQSTRGPLHPQCAPAPAVQAG